MQCRVRYCIEKRYTLLLVVAFDVVLLYITKLCLPKERSVCKYASGNKKKVVRKDHRIHGIFCRHEYCTYQILLDRSGTVPAWLRSGGDDHVRTLAGSAGGRRCRHGGGSHRMSDRRLCDQSADYGFSDPLGRCAGSNGASSGERKHKRKTVEICASVVVAAVLSTIIFNTAGMVLFMGYSLYAILPGRLIQFAVMTPLLCVITVSLYLSPLTQILAGYLRERRARA